MHFLLFMQIGICKELRLVEQKAKKKGGGCPLDLITPGLEGQPRAFVSTPSTLVMGRKGCNFFVIRASVEDKIICVAF